MGQPKPADQRVSEFVQLRVTPAVAARIEQARGREPRAAYLRRVLEAGLVIISPDGHGPDGHR